MVTDWPCDIGDADPGAYFPSTDLFAIIRRANLYAGVDRKLVIATACDCARNHDTMLPGSSWDTATSHCEWIRWARKHAEDDKWPECIEALGHIGATPVSTPTAATAQPWMCGVPAPDDPDENLFATIKQANTSAPDPDATLIISKACDCADHPATSPGTQWSTLAEHVAWTVEARTEAAAMNWSACIDALEHVGGGGNGGGEFAATQRDAFLIEKIVFDFVDWLRKAGKYEAILDKLKIPPKVPIDPKKAKKKKKKS